MANPLIRRVRKPQIRNDDKSKGILDDYSVRKHTDILSGTIQDTPTNDTDISNKKYVDDKFGYAPIGGIIAWHKDFTNTPNLPSGWLECNGQTVSDSASPYNGQALPDMNGNDPTNKRFILGDSTAESGATGGNDIHTHTFTGNQVSTSVQVTQGANNVASGANLQGIHTHTVTPTGTNTNASNLPKYMAMIWIIRIK